MIVSQPRIATQQEDLVYPDSDGQRFLTPLEVEQQFQQERQRAEQAITELEQERQRVEQEHQRAEQEQLRAQRLEQLLREAGIDPDRVS